MNNDTIKTVAAVSTASAPAASLKTVQTEIVSVSRDNVQDAGKARFGGGMMRF